ncbi:MAG: zinc ABC transporter substrate-binding protein [Bacilli bacterium]|nr:zinc ABC transporter substrate-binding protein [Bacilli bacterium]
MKKKILTLGLVIITLLLTGCKSDSMEDIKIYTSVYPIEYVTKELYGEYADIYNMYPQGINPYEYKFTNKQISDFADSDLVIYNGIDNEKDLVVKMINKNKDIKIIDATNKIDYTYNMDELWINPSNILMIAKNVKEGLQEYVSSKTIDKEIENNYDKLKMDLSSIDAELKEMAENSENTTLLVSSNQFNFLSKYGFNIISLDDETFTESYYLTAVDLINNGTIEYIFTVKDTEDNENVKKILDECNDLKKSEIDTINNITTSDKNEGINYLTIMNDNIDKLKKELY